MVQSVINRIEKLCAVVVFYNPAQNMLDNIFSYLDIVSELIIIDNSDKMCLIDNRIISNVKIKYIKLDRNVGIAKALNIAAEYAIFSNYNYLLTLDQDSSISIQTIRKLYNLIEGNCRVGIVSPYQQNNNYPTLKNNVGVYEVDTVITSGNILSLAAYQYVGGFEDKLFIDYVDFEFCLKLRKNKYKILIDDSLVLDHKLGDLQVRRFFGKKVSVTNHNAKRYYYRTRNRLFVLKKYWNVSDSFNNVETKLFFTDIVKIILYEKNKFSKVLAILYGIIDFVRKKYERA